jgi:UDP-N-acetylbacillosamine N-acetyltransferase
LIQPAPTGSPPLVIYGCGGHGQAVAEAAEAAGQRVLGFLDDQREPPLSRTASSPTAPLLEHHDPRLDECLFIVGIGDNATRITIGEKLKKAGRLLTNVIHPSATISPTATIGSGIFISAHAVVQTNVKLADHVILNTGSIVEHYCEIDTAAHIAPGAVLGGDVQVGRETLIGLGSRVLPRLKLAPKVVLGAGSTLTRNADKAGTWVGSPARRRS